jgi:hypothetical protein
LEDFQQRLSSEHKEQLKSIAMAHDHMPDATDALQFTDEINKNNSARRSRARVFKLRSAILHC